MSVGALSLESVSSTICLTWLLLTFDTFSSYVSSRSDMNQYFSNCIALVHLENYFSDTILYSRSAAGNVNITAPISPWHKKTPSHLQGAQTRARWVNLSKLPVWTVTLFILGRCKHLVANIWMIDVTLKHRDINFNLKIEASNGIWCYIGRVEPFSLPLLTLNFSSCSMCLGWEWPSRLESDAQTVDQLKSLRSH